MKRGITITTSKYTKDFLRPLLDSIKDVKYPIVVLSNGGYVPNLDYFPERLMVGLMNGDLRDENGEWELGEGIKLIVNPINGWELAGIQAGKDNFDSFVHLMDTTIVKDISLFDKLLAIEGNVVLTKGNFHYMGKFISKQLPNLPIVKDKQMAVYFEARWLPKPYTEFIPDLPVHSNVFETIHGQYRMKLENEYMIKWKGTWVESPEHPIPK